MNGDRINTILQDGFDASPAKSPTQRLRDKPPRLGIVEVFR